MIDYLPHYFKSHAINFFGTKQLIALVVLVICWAQAFWFLAAAFNGLLAQETVSSFHAKLGSF